MEFEASKRGIAQIHFAASEAIVGTGFLVAEGYLLTCAHVVREALSAPADPLGASVQVTFFNASAPQQAIVVFYEFEEQRYGRDAAVLYLPEGWPEDRSEKPTPAPLRALRQYHGAELQVFGYPDNDAAGRNLTAVTRGEVSGGWVQIEDTKVTGLAVEAGFSGAPVWCKAEGGIVGMVVARHDGRANEKVGFMISVQQLQAARQAIEQHSGQSPMSFHGGALAQTSLTERVNTESFTMTSQELSSSERFKLVTTLNSLTPAEFEVLISTLKPSGGIVPPSSAAQGLRSAALLQWIEGPTGPQLKALQVVLGQVLTGTTLEPERTTMTHRSHNLMDVLEGASFSTVKKKVLKNRLTSLISQYEALSEQYDASIDAQQKTILKSRIDKIEDEISSIELEIGGL